MGQKTRGPEDKVPGEIPVEVIVPESNEVQPTPEETELTPIIDVPVQQPQDLPVPEPSPNPFIPEEKPQVNQ